MRFELFGFAWMLVLLLLQSCRAAPRHIDSLSAKAAEISSFMNNSINPCDDFYKFACGNWPKIYPANNGSSKTTGRLEHLKQGLDQKLNQTLKDEQSALDTPEDVQVKNFYKSCLVVHEIGEDYRQKLRNIIAEFGSMPALVGDAWQESQFDWLETIARISHKYGLNIIVGVDIEVDIANNVKNAIYISQQEFLLETRSMYLDNRTAKFRALYKKAVAICLQSFLGLEKDKAAIVATEIVNFEVQLAHGLLNEADGLGIMDVVNLTTVADMQRIYAPSLDVERLVNITIGEQIKGSVYDYNPQYQHNMIRAINRTSKSTVANYIFYQLMHNFIIDPSRTEAERVDNCVQCTKKQFSQKLDKMVYKRFNENKSTSDIEFIWQALKSNFRQTLESDESLNWISRKTKDLAIEKLAAMKLQISSHVDENLAEDFEGLQLQSDDYVENLRQIFMLSARQSLQKLHQPAEPLDMGEKLSYSPLNILLENTVQIPVALLQPDYLWSPNYPNAIKFGTLASLIGHELIHGFDDAGQKFDKLGNSRDWWDEESAANFVQRQQCFTEQYANYSYYGRQLPKMKGQSENIADNGGVRLAYAAYRRWLDAQADSEEGRKQLLKESLPTLSYTNTQLFFISFAQFWCNDVHPNVRDILISTDEHMPGEFRVIGVLSNFEEFSKEFQCDLGTPMNPAKKCIIY